MAFNSLSFLIFFPIVVFLYFICPPKVQWPFLLIASYIFYLYADPYSVFADHYGFQFSGRQSVRVPKQKGYGPK